MIGLSPGHKVPGLPFHSITISPENIRDNYDIILLYHFNAECGLFETWYTGFLEWPSNVSECMMTCDSGERGEDRLACFLHDDGGGGVLVEAF